ncbi:MAG: hypothetical protein ACI9SG_002603 [Maribacter sp.]
MPNRISAISKVGTTDLLCEQGNTAVSYETYENVTVLNDLSTIPENTFVFAFKYLSRQDGKVKVTNVAATEGYILFRKHLASHNQGEQFFVLKDVIKSTTDSREFLGIYSQNGVSYDSQGNAGGTHLFSEGDTNTLAIDNIVQRVCVY